MKTWLPLALGLGVWAALPASATADWDAKQLKLVRSASTSLRAAVLTAERELKGKAYFAQTNIATDTVTYTVRVDAGDKPVVAEIDGKSGKITGSAAATGENTALLKEFGKLKGGLLAAMKAAESTAKGKSFQASFKRLGAKDVFEVDVAGRDDIEKDVVVDALTGKIRKVAEKSPEAGASANGSAPAAASTP